MSIKLRAHHLMCIHGFQGRGYSPEFTENFWKVASELSSNVGASIEIVNTTGESICEPCPNKRGTNCAEQPKITALDGAYESTLGVKAGDTMTWGEATDLVRKNVTDDAFEKNCEPCGWKAFGVCKTALQKLRGATGVLALALAFATFAHAADEPQQLVGVEEVEQKLLNDPAKRIYGLDQLSAAYGKRDARQILAHVNALADRPEFADYSRWLTAEAELLLAEDAIYKKAWDKSVDNSAKAVTSLSLALTALAHSPLKNRVELGLARADILKGQALMGKHQNKSAMLALESGFLRYQTLNQLAFVPHEVAVEYAKRCEAAPTEVCTSWEVNLAPQVFGQLGLPINAPGNVSKKSDARYFTRALLAKPTPAEKSASTTYRVDLDLQEFQKGFDAYLSGKFDEAYVIWRNLLRDYPRTSIKLRTKFWMARSAQRAEHPAHAETLFREVIRELPFSYYALLSSWFGGIDLSRMMDAELPGVSTEEKGLDAADILRLHRAEKFLASQAPELASLELKEIKPDRGMSKEFLVYLALLNHLARNHLGTFNIFGELSSRGYLGMFSSFGKRILFPTTYLPQIRVAAANAKVDPLLAISIVKQESAFIPDATSVAKAYGLMQLILPTARDLSPGISAEKLFKPEVNVGLGTRYIRQMLNRYDGGVVNALAAYNAGPGNSDRWRRQSTPGMPVEEMIEGITFRETREYVQNILRNYYWYSRKTQGESIPSLDTLVGTFTKR